MSFLKCSDLPAEWGSLMRLLNTVFPRFQPQNLLYETLSFSGECREKTAMGPGEPGKRHSWHLGMKHWSWFKWMEATEPCAQDACTGTWCWTATTADLVTRYSISVNPNSSFNMTGGEKSLGERGKQPTGIFLQNQSILSIQSRHRGFTTLHFEFDYLRALFGPGEGTKFELQHFNTVKWISIYIP